MKIFRCSFSILDPWSKGDFDTALQRYWRVEIPPTPAMEQGKILHQQWQSETNQTGCLPAIFGSKKLKKPETEVKLELMVEPWLQYVGVIDCMDYDEFYEYKSGRSGASHYMGTWQPKCYQYLCGMSGYPVHTAHVLTFNQHTQKTQRGKMYLSPKSFEDAKEWILTTASEMWSAIQEGELKK